MNLLSRMSSRIAEKAHAGVRHFLGGALAVFSAATFASAQSTTVVISQVYGAGGNNGATYNADFVELLNLSSSPVSLSGMSLQYASSTGGFSAGSNVYPLSGTIQPGKYFLVAMATGTNGSALPVTADLTGTLSLAANNGKVALVQGTDAAGTPASATGGVFVDFVGFGTATLFEGSAAAPAPNTTLSIFRAGNGATDTNQNGADFSTAAVSPRNSESPGIPVGEDTTPPVLAASDPLVPANGEAAAPLNTTLAIKFSEAVNPVTGGTVTLYQTGNPTPIETIDVENLFSVYVDGSTVSITLGSNLTTSTSYHVLVSPGAFEDLAGNDFAGITETTGPNAWAFTAAPPDTVGPVAQTLTPPDASTTVAEYGIPFSANIVFDELIDIGPASGAITLHDGTTDALLETLDAEEVTVGGFGDTAYLAFDYELAPAVSYKVKVAAGAIVDTLGNANLAFEWTFTAKPEPPSAPLTSSGPYTQDFATFGPESTSTITPLLPLGWSVKGLVTGFNADTAQRAWGTGTGSGIRGDLGENIFGYQHTGSTSTSLSPNFDKILTLRNETGSVINNLIVSYTGRVNRVGEGRKPAYVVTVDGVTVPGLGYSTEAGVDANVSGPVTGLNIAPGEIFQIIWSSTRDLNNSGSSRQIGLSNVSVDTGTGAFPPALVGPSHLLGELTDTGMAFNTDITSDNGSAVTARGLVYALTSANADPAIGGSGVIQVADAGGGTGVFTSTLSGLTPATSYSVKTYATNANGTTYSPVIAVSTLPVPPSFTGTYTQPFDNYAGAWPAGWTAVSSLGLQAFNGTLAWSGGATNGGFYGGEENPGLLGYLHTSTSGDLEVELTLVNDTGAPLTQLYVSYLGRTGNLTATRLPAWEVTLDGVVQESLAYSTADGTDQNIGTLLTGLNIPVGQRFVIKWKSNRGEGGGGSRKIGIGEVYVGLDAPPTGGFASWLETNDPDGTLTDDHDDDGVPNGVEYFFGLTGSGFTANPQLVNGKITWPDAGVEDLAYAVQISTTLAVDGWTDVPAGSLDLTVPGFISYTPPTPTPGQPKIFIRFLVETPP